MVKSQKMNTFVRMNEIEGFKREVISHGMMCEKYGKIWEESQSRKQIFDMGVSTQGSATLCKALSEGWGVTPEYITQKYKHYINDNYISEQDGYKAKMYCSFEGTMLADVTHNVIINSKGTIKLAPNMVCEIKLVNSNCHIEANGFGDCVVIKYGECNITFADNLKHHIKNGL